MYGDLPTALAFYSAFNVVANLALIRLVSDLQTGPLNTAEIEQRESLWANILVLLVCIPGAFLLQENGPWLLLLLIVSGRVPRSAGHAGKPASARLSAPARRRCT